MFFDLIFSDETLYHIEKEYIPQALQWKGIGMLEQDCALLSQAQRQAEVLALVQKYCTICINAEVLHV